MQEKLLNVVNASFDRFFGRAAEITPRQFWLGFATIAVLGTVFRFWNLASAPIWMDEAVSLAIAELPFSAILFNTVDNHPPLSFLIQKIWQSIVPDPAYARVPAAAIGSLTVGVLMLALRDTISPAAALIAGLLFALATGHIYYSQDARMYPYLILGLTIALWGGLGLVRPNLHSARIYATLYVLGGAIAIYSHMVGLVVMALIGFSCLAAGIKQDGLRIFGRRWLMCNVILFFVTLVWLVQIPSAAGTFPGLFTAGSMLEIQWFYRNITGFPGIGKFSILFEFILYAAALLSIPIAWRARRQGLTVMLVALLVVFPLILLALHLRQPILANKVLLPGLLGVVMVAGYTLSKTRSLWLRAAVTSIIASAAAASSMIELGHHVKAEDYPRAFAYVDDRGFSTAPVITCSHFSTAAVWEARSSARLYLIKHEHVLQYHDHSYWRAAVRSMAWLRSASLVEIDLELGGGWLVSGGLGQALQNDPQVAFIRPNCGHGETEIILAQLADLGYEVAHETLIRGKAATYQILDKPLTQVTLFKRTASASF